MDTFNCPSAYQTYHANIVGSTFKDEYIKSAFNYSGLACKNYRKNHALPNPMTICFIEDIYVQGFQDNVIDFQGLMEGNSHKFWFNLFLFTTAYN